MSKSFWDYAAPVLGGALGTVLLPGIGTSLGLGLGGLGGGAIGAGIGSGLATGIETGKPLAGLTSGIASGVGSYAGGQLLGPSLGGLGGASDAVSGAASPGFMGTSLAKSLGDAGLTGAESVFGSQTPGALLGGAVGSSTAQSAAESALPGLYQSEAPTQAGASPFAPSRQAAANLPSSLSGYGNMDPLQQATNIASKGVYGGGQGPEETNYFTNLINRQLVGDNGQVASDTSSINPVENSFLNQIGLGGYKNPTDLLQGISNYKFS